MIHRNVVNCVLISAILVLPSVAVADSFIDRLSNFFNLSLSSGQMRGPGDDAATGSIWISNLERKTTARVTPDSSYRSPFFSTSKAGVFALQGDVLVYIQAGGLPEEVRKANGIVKLIGFDSKNPDEILVLLKDDKLPLGVLSLKTGNISLLPYDPKSDSHKLVLDGIRGQARITGTTRVFVKSERRQGLFRITEWTDIYIQQGDAEPQNVSNCDGVDCSQPALSPDGQQVTFVKADK